jgi:hypothetical protein
VIKLKVCAEWVDLRRDRGDGIGGTDQGARVYVYVCVTTSGEGQSEGVAAGEGEGVSVGGGVLLYSGALLLDGGAKVSQSVSQ